MVMVWREASGLVNNYPQKTLPIFPQHAYVVAWVDDLSINFREDEMAHIYQGLPGVLVHLVSRPRWPVVFGQNRLMWKTSLEPIDTGAHLQGKKVPTLTLNLDEHFEQAGAGRESYAMK